MDEDIKEVVYLKLEDILMALFASIFLTIILMAICWHIIKGYIKHCRGEQDND